MEKGRSYDSERGRAVGIIVYNDTFLVRKEVVFPIPVISIVQSFGMFVRRYCQHIADRCILWKGHFPIERLTGKKRKCIPRLKVLFMTEIGCRLNCVEIIKYLIQIFFRVFLPVSGQWKQAVMAFQDYPFKTVTGLPFQYTLKTGKNGEWTKELWIDRREKSKSLSWSSVVLAFKNSRKTTEVVERPKALGDIRGISYIYPILWRLELIRVPEKFEKKMACDDEKNAKG